MVGDRSQRESSELREKVTLKCNRLGLVALILEENTEKRKCCPRTNQALRCLTV